MTLPPRAHGCHISCIPRRPRRLRARSSHLGPRLRCRGCRKCFCNDILMARLSAVKRGSREQRVGKRQPGACSLVRFEVLVYPMSCGTEYSCFTSVDSITSPQNVSRMGQVDWGLNVQCLTRVFMQHIEPSIIVEIQWQSSHRLAPLVHLTSSTTPWPREIPSFPLTIRLVVVQKTNSVKWRAPISKRTGSPR